MNNQAKKEWIIFNKIWKLREKQNFQKKEGRKFIGGLTIELLREEFLKLGLNVSNRDVFIEGLHNELDLIIAKANKNPIENLIYLPSDVLIVFEIKFRGSYGASQLKKTIKVFDSIKRINNKIECIYVTISERANYIYRLTTETLGYDCFELFTRQTDLENALKRNKMRITGDLDRLLGKIQKIACR